MNEFTQLSTSFKRKNIFSVKHHFLSEIQAKKKKKSVFYVIVIPDFFLKRAK